MVISLFIHQKARKITFLLSIFPEVLFLACFPSLYGFTFCFEPTEKMDLALKHIQALRGIIVPQLRLVVVHVVVDGLNGYFQGEVTVIVPDV